MRTVVECWCRGAAATAFEHPSTKLEIGFDDIVTVCFSCPLPAAAGHENKAAERPKKKEVEEPPLLANRR